jgi:hypothetical protein
MTFFIATFISFGETANDTNKIQKSELQKAILRRTGGMVYSEGKGGILFIDCQSTLSHEIVRDRVDYTAFVLKYRCKLVKGKWDMNVSVPDSATVAIYLVDGETMPMSLVAVESRWGLINTRNLKSGNRFAKELTRIITLTAGAAYSPAKTSVMKTITKAENLDSLPTDGFTQDMAMAIFSNMNNLGATQSRPTSYLRACREGWASAPTNEYQKAIWNEVHAAPKNPMKIEFDPKKGR